MAKAVDVGLILVPAAAVALVDRRVVGTGVVAKVTFGVAASAAIALQYVHERRSYQITA